MYNCGALIELNCIWHSSRDWRTVAFKKRHNHLYGLSLSTKAVTYWINLKFHRKTDEMCGTSPLIYISTGCGKNLDEGVQLESNERILRIKINLYMDMRKRQSDWASTYLPSQSCLGKFHIYYVGSFLSLPLYSFWFNTEVAHTQLMMGKSSVQILTECVACWSPKGGTWNIYGGNEEILYLYQIYLKIIKIK